MRLTQPMECLCVDLWWLLVVDFPPSCSIQAKSDPPCYLKKGTAFQIFMPHCLTLLDSYSSYCQVKLMLEACPKASLSGWAASLLYYCYSKCCHLGTALLQPPLWILLLPHWATLWPTYIDLNYLLTLQILEVPLQNRIRAYVWIAKLMSYISYILYKIFKIKRYYID